MRWEPWVKAIISQHLLIPATFEEDTQQGTDLRILKHGDIRIAQRVRKAGYTRNYGDEITFTFGHENGMPCEWTKAVIEKKANLFFYGHASNDDPRTGEITHWFFIDLDKCRGYLLSRDWTPAGVNKDAVGRRCSFVAFKPDKCFPEAIIARWSPWTVTPTNPFLTARPTESREPVPPDVGHSLFDQMRKAIV